MQQLLLLLACTGPTSDSKAPVDSEADSQTDSPADSDADTDTDTDTDSDTDSDTDADTDSDADADPWSVTVVDPIETAYTSVALDPLYGEPVIAYQDISGVNQELKFANRVRGFWETELVDDNTISGGYVDLAYTSDGSFVMSYAAFGDLTFTQGLPGSWSTETIRPGARGPTSVLPDGAGDWIFADTDSIGGFEVVQRDGSYDVIEGSSSGAISQGVMRLGSSGVRHVAFEDGDFYEVEYGYYDGVAWQLQVVEEMGATVSLAMDGENPVLAYHMWLDGELHVARWNGVDFDITTVDADVGYVVTGISVAVDDQGRTQVAWHSLSKKAVFWAIQDGGSWVVEKVEATGRGAGAPDLAVFGSQPSISYSAEGEMHLARRQEP